MLATMYKSFLGSSPNWFKIVIIVFLALCYPAMLVLGDIGHTVIGWAFIAMFILSLAMALKCYPLQSGGLLAIATLALGADVS